MEALPQQADCCQSCEDVVSVAVPGPQGPAGADGTDGAPGQDGLDAWTTTTADFTMPAEGATVDVYVEDNRWMFVGQIVQVEGAGWFEVAAVPLGDTTVVTLENVEDSGTGEYDGNVAPGTVVASGAKVSPSGPSGPTGGGGAPVDATYWTSSADPALTSEVDMSAIGDGYVKVASGAPSAVDEVPDEDIEYQEQTIAATDIDWSAGRTFYKLLTGNTAFTFSNTVGGKQILVVLKQGTGTSYTASFPASVKWTGAVAPTMTTTSDAYAVFSFYKCATTGDIIGTVLNDAY